MELCGKCSCGGSKEYSAMHYKNCIMKPRKVIQGERDMPEERNIFTWKDGNRVYWKLEFWKTGEVENISEWNPTGDYEWGCLLTNQDTHQKVWQGYIIGQYDIVPDAVDFLKQWVTECVSVLTDAVYGLHI